MAAGDVDRLIADLRGRNALRRDSAIARLRILGSRAVARLSPLVTDPDPQIRVAALNALDGIEDTRVIDVALGALSGSDASSAVAALGVLRGWLAREQGTLVLEAVARTALDRQRDAEVRLAALDALSELPRTLVQPILESLDSRALARDKPLDGDGRAILGDAATAREWIATHGATAPLSHLHQLVVAIRERERAEPSAQRRQEWVVTRGAAHAALAQRGSRVALYDLREAFDAAAGALPLDYLTAVNAIGDASCLEPMARAWAAAPGDSWWRDRVSEAAAEIMHRTRLSGRSAVVKRIRAKWSGFL